MTTGRRHHEAEIPELSLTLPLAQVQLEGPTASWYAGRYFAIFAVVLPILLAPVFLTLVLLFQGDEVTQHLMVKYNLAAAKVGFLGDSTLRAHSACESDTDGIDDLLAVDTGWPVTTIASAGHTPTQWSVLAGLFDHTRNKPKVVVFPINLRSYSTGWSANPAWQFGAQMQYIKILSGDLTAIPRFVYDSVFDDVKADTEVMMDTEISAMGRRFGSMAELAQRSEGVPLNLECQDNPSQYDDAMKAKFIMNYMHDLTADHPLLRSLEKLVDTLSSQGIRVVTYLVPINVVDGNARVGPEFVQVIRQNRAIITAVLERKKVPYIDLTELSPSEDFADKGCACEHLAAPGRKAVARSVADLLRSLPPDR